MKLPEPVVELDFYVDEGGPLLRFTPRRYGHLVNGTHNLYTEDQLQEALAQQADQLTYQLQEQNRWLDAKLAQQEDVMRRALNFIQEVDRDDNDRDFLCQRQCETLDEVRSLLLEALDKL